MKTMNLNRLTRRKAAGTTAAILLAICIGGHAQTLDTILDLPTSSGGPYSSEVGRAILIDLFSIPNSLPQLLVSGQIPGLTDLNGTPYKLFRLAQSNPLTPSAPDLEPLHASGATVYSMTSDSLGNLYWAGGLNSPSGNKWIVRRSSDGGASWQELQRFPSDSAHFARARGIVVEETGRLVVCGVAMDAAGYSHWIVQTSEDEGLSWNATELFPATQAFDLFSNYNLEATAVTSLPAVNGGLFVVGSRNNTWTVTRSRDGGATWQTVDLWTPKRGQMTYALKVASDAAGRLFVLGGDGGSPRWVVRMSEDGGDSWKTVFGPWSSSGGYQTPNDFAIDAHGSLWLAGATFRQSGKGKTASWTSVATVVRLQESASGAWAWSEYPVAPAAQGVNRAEASAITADSLGNVYVNVSFKANDTTDWRWLVQRLAP